MFSFGLTDLQAAKKTPPPPSSIALDEDAQKRNTDCIYFLASPLTCKKGANCEYRHSEAARTNPRDCRFWKSGNCLNAYCSFRHLPFEGKPVAAAVNNSAMTHTKAPSAMATSTAAGTGPSKSKTPCYFFAQGYCAKNDQCPFMHGLPLASSTAEVVPQQNHVGVDGKALHASSTAEAAAKPTHMGVDGKVLHTCGRPLILLKQSGLLPREVRPVTNGRPEDLNETNATISRAPGLPKQGVPSGSERSTLPETVASSGNLSDGLKYSQNNKRMLQKQDNLQGLAKVGELQNQNSCQTEALWKDRPSQGGSCKFSGSEEGDYSSPSDSRESSKGPSSSTACNGRDSDEGDLRAHLMKRTKTIGSLNSSRGNGGNPELLAIQSHRGGRLSDNHLKQRKQDQGKVMRKVDEEAAVGRFEGAQLYKRRSAEVPKKGQSRSFAAKERATHQPKVHNIETVAAPEKGFQLSSSLRSKRLMSGAVKETLAFSGPKSLAQIKAEKLAGGNSGFKANGRRDSSSIIAEASMKLSDRNADVPGESRNASAANEKMVSSHRKLVSTMKQDDAPKHGIATAEEFEGPKPLSTLLKRKRDAESGSMGKGSTSGLSEAQVSEPNSLGEMEDGELRSNDDSATADDRGALVSIQEDAVDSPACMKEEIMQGLQGSPREAAECKTESSDHGSKADLDMEETAYAGEDYEMYADDCDDDDEDDFAKKLGRVFGLSYE